MRCAEEKKLEQGYSGRGRRSILISRFSASRGYFIKLWVHESSTIHMKSNQACSSSPSNVGLFIKTYEK